MVIKLKDLTQEIVRELLDYDADTGKLYWRERDVKWFAATRRRTAQSLCDAWNKRYKGTEAFVCKDTNGYNQGSILGNHCSPHRIIWLWWHGVWPNHQIDHFNGNRSDNRIDNLADKTIQENLKNSIIGSSNTSGYKGVSWHKNVKRWRATICIDRNPTHIGYYDSAEEAFAAYVEQATKAGFTERHIFGENQ